MELWASSPPTGPNPCIMTMAKEPVGPMSSSSLAGYTYIPSLFWVALKPEPKPKEDRAGLESPEQQQLHLEPSADPHSFPILLFNIVLEDLPCATTWLSVNDATVAKPRGSWPCGGDILVEEKASNNEQTKEIRLLQMVIETQ